MQEKELPPLTRQQQEELETAVANITEPTPSFLDSKNPLEAWKTQYRRFATYLMRQGKTIEEVNDILGTQNLSVPKSH